MSITSSQPLGYVYIIQAHEPDTCFKIGHSKKPLKRLRQLQTASSSKLDIIHLIPCYTLKPLIVERQLHYWLAHLRRRGEWYTLTSEYIEWLQTLSTDQHLLGHET